MTNAYLESFEKVWGMAEPTRHRWSSKARPLMFRRKEDCCHFVAVISDDPHRRTVHLILRHHHALVQQRRLVLLRVIGRNRSPVSGGVSLEKPIDLRA